MNKFNLPDDHKPFADKYFLRTNEILKKEGLNPFVRAQVFIRKGPAQVYGIDEAVAILEKYGKIKESGGKIKALYERDMFWPKETLMVIEAPIQNIVELETMYLGVISAETTKHNNGIDVDLRYVKSNMEKVVKAANGRDVMYFGARHWRYDKDAEIAKAAFDGGAKACSTDEGGKTVGQLGMGTIPHALENIYAWKYGYENAVVEATKAFDRVIDPNVPRIALVDYANKEIDDTIATAKALNGNLYGIRIDTCGENVGQGALKNEKELYQLLKKNLDIPEKDKKYWFGNGVTITGVYAICKALEKEGLGNIKKVLSSGFADYKKVAAFARAEDLLETRLFDSLGVGQVFESRTATMDIVAVGDTIDTMIPTVKVGREYHPNKKLELILGQEVDYFK